MSKKKNELKFSTANIILKVFLAIILVVILAIIIVLVEISPCRRYGGGWMVNPRFNQGRFDQQRNPAPRMGIANPASVNCVDKGGTLEIKKDDTGGEYGVCKFSDGSECEEWKFFRNECKVGDSLEK